MDKEAKNQKPKTKVGKLLHWTWGFSYFGETYFHVLSPNKVLLFLNVLFYNLSATK